MVSQADVFNSYFQKHHNFIQDPLSKGSFFETLSSEERCSFVEFIVKHFHVFDNSYQYGLIEGQNLLDQKQAKEAALSAIKESFKYVPSCAVNAILNKQDTTGDLITSESMIALVKQYINTGDNFEAIKDSLEDYVNHYKVSEILREKFEEQGDCFTNSEHNLEVYKLMMTHSVVFKYEYDPQVVGHLDHCLGAKGVITNSSLIADDYSRYKKSDTDNIEEYPEHSSKTDIVGEHTEYSDELEL